ncbi:spermidine/putrescine ABC transporter substrate-binding protein PotF [Beijerinckiaceae bacterium]|nr:spermidine/putrescine ABC transporter substrate-binding protein PotF [Beijerinckiaceae bacterium]
MRSIFVVALAVWLCVFGLVFQAVAREKIVNVFGWSDYIDPRVIEDFTKETGIKVFFDTYSSNEDFEKHLANAKIGYDVLIVSGPTLQRQIAAGLYQKLDKSRLPNSKTLWPEVMAGLAAFDPGNQYAVNYLWFTTGIAYNVAKANELLGQGSEAADSEPSPGDSWDYLFKPENLKKFSSCGIYVLDSAEDLFPIALTYLRLDPGSVRQNDLRRAAELLAGIRRDVKKFSSTEYVDALVNGDICLAVGWSGDGINAMNRAHESENGIEISYGIPREGAPMWLDNLAIPKNAPHLDEAYAFMDFLLRPAVAARNSNFTHFATGVLASKSSVDKDLSENKSIYPDPGTMQKLFAVRNRDPAMQKIIAREWLRAKTGK